MINFIVFSCLLAIPLIVDTKYKETIEFMGIEFTTVIKGASILSVVWAHSCAKLNIGGIQFIAGIGVSLFLICSGYGLEVSYSKNRLNGFWKKRILRLCVPFWIVQIIGMAVIGELTLQNLVCALLFIRGNWFIRYIIICYFIFYVSKRLAQCFEIKEDCEFAILCGAFGCWFVVESLFFANPGMPFLEARQMLSFPFGILLVKKKSLLLNLFNKNWTIIMGGYRNTLHDADSGGCYKVCTLFSI